MSKGGQTATQQTTQQLRDTPGLRDATARCERRLRIEDLADVPAGATLIFSAHGLPQQVVDGGDPYQAQIEATAAAASRLCWGVAMVCTAWPAKTGSPGLGVSSTSPRVPASSRSLTAAGTSSMIPRAGASRSSGSPVPARPCVPTPGPP